MSSKSEPANSTSNQINDSTDYTMQVERLTLNFSGPDASLEQPFLELYSFRSLTYVRFSIVMGAVLIGIFGILDNYLLPQHAHLLWFIRYAVLCPAALLIALSTYRKSLVPFLPLFQVFLLILNAIGFTVMIMFSPAPVNYLYYSGLILVLIYGYTFLRLRFIWGTLAGWMIVGIYVFAAVRNPDIPMVILINNLFFLVSANVIGMLASYSIEYYARNDFYLMTKMKKVQHKITETNILLESHVKKRTAELQTSIAKLTVEIDERRSIEEALRESEEKYRGLVENSPDAIVITVDERIVFVNNESLRLMGATNKEELLGKILMQFVHPDSRARINEQMKQVSLDGKPLPAEQEKFIRLDGTAVDVEVKAIPTRFEHRSAFQIIIHDITERISTEQALRHAQKMESIGTLAGGIAHDFNNLLNAIMGQSSLAIGKLPKESPAVSNITKAIHASERAADLTRQLLAYSGRGKFFSVEIDLNNLVHENVQMLQVSVPKTTQLRYELGTPSPHIIGDIGQIQQVIMNLIINAGEAMGPNPGYITVRTNSIELTEQHTEYWKYTVTPLEAGRYAMLQVKDTGSGISQETLARIFDPFFTTKFTGRGLGLAAVLGIIKGHKGGLRIESKVGKGTMFEIVLPLITTSTISNVEKKKEASIVKGEGKTILIIDDDPFVFELLEDVLREVHFTVIGATDPLKGIELYRREHENISMVILDYSMPNMDGKTAFAELKKINTNVKVLLCSGYTEEETLSTFGADRPTGFFQKPYKTEALVERVSKILLEKYPIN